MRFKLRSKHEIYITRISGRYAPNSISSGGGLVASLPNRVLRTLVGGYAPMNKRIKKGGTNNI